MQTKVPSTREFVSCPVLGRASLTCRLVRESDLSQLPVTGHTGAKHTAETGGEIRWKSFHVQLS